MTHLSMRAAALFLLAGSAVALPDPETPTQDRYSKFMSVFVGGRVVSDFNDIDDGFGGEVDLGDHVALGLEFNTMGERGFGFEAGAAFSLGSDEIEAVDADADLTMFELTLGARYTFPHAGRFLPYVGAGIDLIYAELSADTGGVTISDDTGDFGVYGRLGASFLFGDRFTLGVEARALTATSEDLDYVQGALVLGWGI